MWWKSAKLYELYIDKFAGDINGLASKLDYFPKLGVDTLHLLPFYPSPMVDDGYDISDYRGVRRELGTLDEFAHLVKEAHARGIKIIIDLVLNHTSREHPWFLEARSSRENPKRNWYLWSKTGEELAMATNPFPDMKPNNWIYSSDTDDYYFATYYPGQPDLNWDNPEVFDAMTSVMEFWADMGVDGFRLDAAPHLVKREGTTCVGLPETHAVIKKLRARLEQKHPNVILLAEAHQTPALTKTYFGDGDECHMAYQFSLMEQMWLAIAEAGAQEKGDAGHAASCQGDRQQLFLAPNIQQILKDIEGIPANCQWATFLRNHDEISLATLPQVDRERLLAAIDPEHRFPFRKGETSSVRVATAVFGDKQRILDAFKLLYSVPGAPIMYYGDEIGMPNELNIAYMLDTRRHVRGPFDWALAERQMQDPGSLWSQTAAIIKARQ